MNKTQLTVAVQEKPIIFSGPMVRAILEGRKTLTRRVVKPQPEFRDIAGAFASWVFKRKASDTSGLLYPNAKDEVLAFCPYGKVGDRLWVRESFFDHGDDNNDNMPTGDRVEYRATPWDRDDPKLAGSGWKPSIHMPRWASRLTLEITNIRVERLQEISHTDAIAEGMEWDGRGETLHEVNRFREGWNALNAKRGYSWESNPWVWVIEFKKANTQT